MNSINNKDKKKLDLFIKKVDELLNCKLSKTKSKVSFSLHFAEGKGEAVTKLPDEESLRSFLLVFRNFYSPREEINFFKVCDILENAIKDAKLVGNIKKTREIYQEILDKSPCVLVEGDKTVTPHEIIRRWMYGFYHHTNEKKRAKIKAWGFASGLTKTQFVLTVFGLSKCIVWLGNVARNFSKGKIR